MRTYVEREIAALKDMIAILEGTGRKSKRGYVKRKSAIISLDQLGVPTKVIAKQIGMPAWYVRRTIEKSGLSRVGKHKAAHDAKAEENRSLAQ